MAGLLLMMLARSSFFSTLGVVIVLIVFKVSLVEAKMDGRGICILSTFSSGLVGIIHVTLSSMILVYKDLRLSHLETGETLTI